MSATLDFRLVFDSDELRPAEVERSMLSFEKEIAGLDGAERTSGAQTDKEIDPLTFAALSLALAPAAATKFFEFLNAWAMRRENRLIKIKIQLGKSRSIEFEGSETLSKKDVEGWILAIEKALKQK